MIKIGLTGGIGSGKSTVAGLFRKRGAYIIDIDVIAHSVERPGSMAWNSIVQCFGREILNEDSMINREALGGIVFRDNAKLKELNAIVHPVIFDEWQRRINDIGSTDEEAVVLSDIPLLIEVGWHKAVDIVILVYTSPDVQEKRMMERNGYSHEEARARLESQMPIDEKIPFADVVINNEGTLEETETIVDGIWNKLPGKGIYALDQEIKQ